MCRKSISSHSCLIFFLLQHIYFVIISIKSFEYFMNWFLEIPCNFSMQFFLSNIKSVDFSWEKSNISADLWFYIKLPLLFLKKIIHTKGFIKRKIRKCLVICLALIHTYIFIFPSIEFILGIGFYRTSKTNSQNPKFCW